MATPRGRRGSTSMGLNGRPVMLAAHGIPTRPSPSPGPVEHRSRTAASEAATSSRATAASLLGFAMVVVWSPGSGCSCRGFIESSGCLVLCQNCAAR
uniref:Uncharacterized protein n=1 Tax=Arundo donax TaxID=35708 RepID=A0A0A9FJ25_ARUDO